MTLALDRAEVILVHICGEVYSRSKLDQNRKNFLCKYGWMDVRTHLSSNLLGHRLVMT